MKIGYIYELGLRKTFRQDKEIKHRKQKDQLASSNSKTYAPQKISLRKFKGRP